jgi:CRP/FNR family transcriptional regulator, dissimilatory nitrate respiration regulator
MLDHQTHLQLRRHYLFSAFTEPELKTMAQSTRGIELETGQHLFFQGQKADHFYLVIQGQIKLTRLTPDGNEKVIEIILSGQTFAEAVMFMNREEYPVTATAISPTQLYSFQNRAFMEILRNNNEVCFRLLGDVSMRLRGRLQEIENLTMKNAAYRVVRYFLNELEKQPGSPDTMELAIQKQLIASRLSIKPETLSRIFSTLRDQGIIDMQGKALRIVDVERLKAFE